MNKLILARKIIYPGLGILDSVLLRRPEGITIFCYHSISSDSWRFSVTAQEFKNQLDYLLSHLHPISLSDVHQYLNRKKEISSPSFVLTFDDGFKDLMSVKEHVKKLGIKPTIFVLSHPQKTNKTELGTSQDLLKDKDVFALHKSGWEIGCHSATHPDFFSLTSTDLKEEIIESKKTLESKLNLPVEYFAYPKGRYSPAVLAAVQKAGYQLGLTMDDGIISRNTNPLLLPRVGVDGSHSFAEFTSSFSPSVVKLRGMLKRRKIGLNI
ncbi:MAG: polysaccharide deacetylase [Microgenomates group bacterium Gr01-1014_16]|nr:MAG: polysaccharide deacetylase [Microgenomates group bacterium Gr01-1014_16]